MLIKLTFKEVDKLVLSSDLQPLLLVLIVFEALWPADGARKPHLHVGCLLVDDIGPSIAHFNVQNAISVVQILEHISLQVIESICQINQKLLRDDFESFGTVKSTKESHLLARVVKGLIQVVTLCG